MHHGHAHDIFMKNEQNQQTHTSNTKQQQKTK